jgi:O-antigen/teichoic acid export membrane protein
MAANVFNYLFNFAISRRLGVEGFATLASLVGGFMILSIPANIINLVVVKYASEFHATEDAARLRRLASVVFKFGALACVAIFALGVLFRSAAASFLKIPNDDAVTLSLAIIAIAFITPGMRGILQGKQDFAKFSISTTLEIFVKVALGVALVYAGFGVFGALAGWICGTIVGLAYTVWAVRTRGGEVVQPVRLRMDLRRLAQTTLGVALATGTLTILSFMDVVVVKHFFAAHDAGLYAAVNLTGKVVLFFVGFLPMILLPKAVAAVQRRENPTPLLLQAAAGTAVMAGAVLAVFGLVPATILRFVAGSAFVSAAPYVLQYDAAMALLAIVTLLVNYRIGLHRFGFLYGLIAVLVAEVLAIALWHTTLWDVIHVLLGGNALAIVVCCVGLREKREAAA